MVVVIVVVVVVVVISPHPVWPLTLTVCIQIHIVQIYQILIFLEYLKFAIITQIYLLVNPFLLSLMETGALHMPSVSPVI